MLDILGAGYADRVQTTELTLGASQKAAASHFSGVEIFDIQKSGVSADEMSFTDGSIGLKGGTARDSIVIAANGGIVLTSELNAAVVHNTVDLGAELGTNAIVDGSALLAKRQSVQRTVTLL